MPKEMIQQYLRHNRGPDSKKFRIIIQAAPFLKGMKKSCILMIKREELDELREELLDTNIEAIPLHEHQGRSIVLFYRASEMEEYFGGYDVRRFLKKNGYQGTGIADYIERLKSRVTFFYEEEQIFPHEIGVFLGYPIEDVEGFIENAGKNFLLSGYWKVYSNLQMTRELFEKFDRAKEEAMQQWSDGKSLQEIAV